MRIEVDDRHCNMLIDGLDLLIKNYDICGYKLKDVPDMANIGIAIQQYREKIIKEADDEEEKFKKDHPEFARGPNPGEKFVMGRGYVKEKPEEK